MLDSFFPKCLEPEVQQYSVFLIYYFRFWGIYLYIMISLGVEPNPKESIHLCVMYILYNSLKVISYKYLTVPMLGLRPVT